MVELRIRKEEAHIIWAALNYVQSMGLDRLVRQSKVLSETGNKSLVEMGSSWAKETYEEYKALQKVKEQLVSGIKKKGPSAN